MSCRAELNEEYSLPSLEAVLAGTLALMTGYSQALQADQSPGPRVLMGVKIGKNLDLLSDHPGLTDAFHRVVAGLRQRWMQMSACTELSAPAPLTHAASPGSADLPLTLTAPTRLQ